QPFMSPGRNELRTKTFSVTFLADDLIMKKVFSRITVSFLFPCLALFFQSCDVDNYVPDDESHLTQMKHEASPENPANDYDVTGELMYEICHEYLEKNLTLSATDSIINEIESLASLNNLYLSLVPPGYVSPSSSRIDSIA